MAPQTAMDVARHAAVMVRVHGPDPKGRKMRRHAFFHSESGDTTLSASGFLVLGGIDMDQARKSSLRLEECEKSESCEPLVVITCASIVEPFLAQRSHGSSSAEESPKLIRGTEVDILVEVSHSSIEGVHSGDHSVCWLPAQLLTVVDVPAAGTALQDLLDVHGGSVKGVWEVGWALASVEDNAQQLHSLLTAEVLTDTQLQDDVTLQHEPRGDRQSASQTLAGVSRLGVVAMAATRVAVLTVGSQGGDYAALNGCLQKLQEFHGISQMPAGYLMAESRKRGDSLIAVGSPFGALSPLHFHNSMSVGIVSNSWPPSRSPGSLLMADMRCLPGMEGGPVFDEHGALVGMLTRPLRQRGGAAEVQLVMTWNVLAPALQGVGIALGCPFARRLQRSSSVSSGSPMQERVDTPLQVRSCRAEVEDPHPALQFSHYVPSAVEQAMASVVLITIGDGAWASGIILNKDGLILTNAHLLEPWRFGKTRISQLPAVSWTRQGGSLQPSTVDNWQCKTGLACTFCGENCPQDVHPDISHCGGVSRDDVRLREPLYVNNTSEGLSSVSSRPKNGSLSVHASAWPVDTGRKNYQRIRVRLDHRQPRSWHAARPIYVSQGPLDIALLQLGLPPPGLCPIVPEKECPTPGSTAVVLGHGLFGPRSELRPSVTAGVVARIVKAGTSSLFTRAAIRAEGRNEGKSCDAAMLQTTAAVHPGGSGGAVVNGEGHLIGLVTSFQVLKGLHGCNSNARHSGGTVIPYLNFSVPFAALAPIFEFAFGDGSDWGPLLELDKPNEQLAAVWALVPPTPPRPSQLPRFSGPQAFTPLPDVEGEGEPRKGSRFADYISKTGPELSLKLPALVEHGAHLQSPTQPARLEPSYSTRGSLPLHNRLSRL